MATAGLNAQQLRAHEKVWIFSNKKQFFTYISPFFRNWFSKFTFNLNLEETALEFGSLESIIGF